ncbi:MAG TPA: dihydroorotase, partial [Alphaproteobacteria bacterium]|nr:dihydroorotase [Alphaproteobacteria bacterium]
APHVASAKESACGCAGIFCAPQALELYAEIFEAEGALHKLENFASLNGARFYGLPVNEEKVTLIREDAEETPGVNVPGGGQVVSFSLGKKRGWRILPQA